MFVAEKEPLMPTRKTPDERQPTREEPLQEIAWDNAQYQALLNAMVGVQLEQERLAKCANRLKRELHALKTRLAEKS
jgi:hypothetical protein